MMATYFNSGGAGGSTGGSEIQADSLQTLYLMNPSYSAYSDHHQEAAPPPNMVLFNPAAAGTGGAENNALNPGNFHQHQQPQQHQQQQHFVGIPLTGATAASANNNLADDPTRQTHHHNLHDIQTSSFQGLVPRLHQYNLWSLMDPNTPTGSQQPHIPTAVAVSAAANVGGGDVGFRRPAAVVAAASLHQHQRQQQQGLSLSLSPHDKQNNNNVSGQQGPVTVVSSGNGGGGEHHIRMSGVSSTSVSAASTNGVPGVHHSMIMGSKYLKAAQQLLDEVANAMNSGDRINKDKAKATESSLIGGEGSSTGGSGGCAGGGESSSGKLSSAELTTAQRQELQMKKAKLLNMVDEVEQRYRQYHSQIQMVVSSFEQAAGLGSAKSYTALALQTISKQFRCLKDSITSQFKATSKSLGEDESQLGGVKVEGGSRLKFVDHQLRQQRALQQLGMIQHDAWRPQRGLPEKAVSVLRAWLFEHFLHPYPKDSDKHMLAKQTGLTRSQVSNWFINARVRLWKPMVEEMYLEEMKSQEQNMNNNGSNDDNNTNNLMGSRSNTTHEQIMKKDMISSSSKSAAPQMLDNNNNSISGMTRIHEQQHQGYTRSPNHHQNLLSHHLSKTTTTTNTNGGISNSTTTMSPISAPMGGTTLNAPQGFSLIGSHDNIDPTMDPRSHKKQRNNTDMHNSPSSILSMEMEIKPGHDHHPAGRDHHHHHLLGVLKYGQPPHETQSFMSTGPNINHGFGSYQIGDLGRFDSDQLAQRFHGNGVSLTLGLPYSDHHHQSLPFSGTPALHHQQQNFITTQGMQLGGTLDMGGGGESDFVGMSAPQSTHSSDGYDNMDNQNRKRFAAQLLPDFVV